MTTLRRSAAALIVLAAGASIAPWLPPTIIAAAARPAETPTPAVRLDDAAGGGAGPPRAAAGPETAPPATSATPSRPVAILRDGRDLVLAVPIGPRDTFESVGRQHLAVPGDTALLRALNHDRDLAAGAVLEIPYAHLNADARGRTIADLFPGDGPRDGDWIHAVGQGRVAAPDESLWCLALWYTGRGENFRTIAGRNGMVDLSPRGGREIVIPGDLLQPPFARRAAKTAPHGPFESDPRSDAAGAGRAPAGGRRRR